MIVKLIPTILSFLLLAAHFSRAGHIPLVVISLALLALLLIKRRWAWWLLQAALVVSALEWWRTAFVLATLRAQHGLPYLRLLVILFAVSMVSLLAVVLLRRPRVRRWFGTLP